MEELEKLKKENEELKAMHYEDLAEIVRLRRWIQALEEKPWWLQ